MPIVLAAKEPLMVLPAKLVLTAPVDTPFEALPKASIKS